MPNIMAVIFIYTVLAFALIILIIPLIPFFSFQSQSLLTHFPIYLDKVAHLFKANINVGEQQSFITSRITDIGSNIFSVTTRVFTIVLLAILGLFISIYLLVDYQRIQKNVASFFTKDTDYLYRLFDTVENKLGAWARGQVLLSAVIGLTFFTAYFFIRLDYAFPLALFAAIAEFIPTIGPVIGAIPALIIALTISPFVFLITFGAYIVIHVLESNFFAPLIMNQAVGLHPIAVMLAILIGGEIMGIAGAIVAVPFLSMCIVIYSALEHNRAKKS